MAKGGSQTKGNGLSLEAAIAAFMATRTTLKQWSVHRYRTALGKLEASYPGYDLEAFEPPVGTVLVREVLDKTWGQDAPETYRGRLSNSHVFFQWHRAAGNLTGDPTVGLTYPPIERRPRRTITRAQAEALIRANPDPRDQVPLRLLLTLGMTKDMLQELRFGDLDASVRTVVFGRKGVLHARHVEDRDFWDAVETLTHLRRAASTHYVLCREKSRKRTPTAVELDAMTRSGALDGGRAYLWLKYDGEWYRAKMTPALPRTDHGIHLWWYRCAGRAGW